MNWGLLWTAVGALAAFGGLLLMVGKWLGNRIEETKDQNRQLLAKQEQFESDWSGEPARPGVARRPGVMERLEKLDSNTSGLPDRMASAESRLGKVEDRLGLLEEAILRRSGGN